MVVDGVAPGRAGVQVGGGGGSGGCQVTGPWSVGLGPTCGFQLVPYVTLWRRQKQAEGGGGGQLGTGIGLRDHFTGPRCCSLPIIFYYIKI